MVIVTREETFFPSVEPHQCSCNGLRTVSCGFDPLGASRRRARVGARGGGRQQGLTAARCQRAAGVAADGRRCGGSWADLGAAWDLPPEAMSPQHRSLPALRPNLPLSLHSLPPTDLLPAPAIPPTIHPLPPSLLPPLHLSHLPSRPRARDLGRRGRQSPPQRARFTGT